MSEYYAAEYLANILDGKRQNCSIIARQYLEANHSITDLYENVFKVALYEVGRLWEINQISVATEHLSTAITEGILNELFEQLYSIKRYNKKVVVACIEKEMHQVGIKMVADTFEMNGWESFYLGSGIPLHELTRYISQVKPDFVAVSLTVYFNISNLLKLIETLYEKFPALQILVGGQAFTQLSPLILQQYSNIIHFPDLYLLNKFIESINNQLKN